MAKFITSRRATRQLSSLCRSAPFKQSVRFNSSQSPHQVDEVQELAKTLNGMLRHRWGSSQGFAQGAGPHYDYIHHWHRGPWGHRRRSLFWPLLLFGGGAYTYCTLNKKEEERRQLEVALAKARATGDFTNVDSKMDAQKHCHRGWRRGDVHDGDQGAWYQLQTVTPNAASNKVV